MAASTANYSDRWENMWAAGLKPGDAFDACQSSPALVDLLTNNSLDVKNKRIFIPGCGRGYDLTTFIKHGAAEAVGLEIAPSAVPAAQQEVTANLGEEESHKASIVQGDFFKWSDPSSGFDIGYDYTFFCALHPDMRADWAPSWYRHLKPGGQLVTLIFPIEQDGREGPPWPVSVDLYEKLLLGAGFEGSVPPKAVPDEMSHKGREGKEYMAVWVKK